MELTYNHFCLLNVFQIMKRGVFLITVLIFIYNFVQCQAHIGLSAGYKFVDYPNWNYQPISNSQSGELAIFSNNIFIGVEYIKQIKKTSLNAWVLQMNLDKSLSNITYANIINLSLQLGYRFYPFNQQDCDCPSFYQTGSVFSRGFNISPRIGTNTIKIIDEQYQFQIIGGVDLSLDIPINKFISIGPYTSISLTSYAKNYKLLEITRLSNANSIQIGMKLIRALPSKQYRFR